MNKVMIVMTAVLGACAATPPEPEVVPSKFSATQVQTPSMPEFVICRDEACNGRTAKYIAMPKPVVKKTVVTPAPAPVAPIAVEKPAEFAVHFRLGRYRLDRDGLSEMLPVIAHIHKGTVKSVLIEGRTDPTGTLKGNQKLAVNRANEVKSHLVRAGVSAELITAKAQEPCCDGNKKAGAAQMQALRRADLSIRVTLK